MGKIAFLFAGQGAQYPGMGKGIYEGNEAAKRIFDMCESIRPGILQLCFNGDADALNQTINTQPCLFAMDLACGRALESQGVRPDAVAGYSLGEVAAAAFAGLMTDEDAFRLVLYRAEVMAECAHCNPGGMAAILRLDAGQIERLCDEIGGVYPVNYNCPGQVSVAGEQASLDILAERVTELRGRCIPVAVSGAFHCPHMDEAAAALAERLRDVKALTQSIPIYSNYTAQPYPQQDASLLARQVNNPVRWQDILSNIVTTGIDTVIEVGAGKTLSGFANRMKAGLTVYNVEDMDGLSKVVAELEAGYA